MSASADLQARKFTKFMPLRVHARGWVAGLIDAGGEERRLGCAFIRELKPQKGCCRKMVSFSQSTRPELESDRRACNKR